MIIESFLKKAKNNFNKSVMSDSTGMSLTYGQVLTASILLSKHIRNFEGNNIAILFPSSVGGALAHIAIALTLKTPVGLNFIASKEDQEYVLKLCEVKTIFTSRKFIEKAMIDEDDRMVFIEDIQKMISKSQKLLTFFSCKLQSVQSLINKFKIYDGNDKTAVLLFTSGSEAHPKGVQLTNFNIFSSIQSYSAILDERPDDVILAALPFFHVFGFVVCLWFPLLVGAGAFFYPNPTDYERLGKIVLKHKITILLGTSTLYRGFMRKWHKDQVQSVRLAYAGAEKLNKTVRERFNEKLGIKILEAYGITETCACVSANPSNDYRNGSVGRCLHDIDCKIVNPDTFEEVPHGKDGLILVKGPNIMKGYYKEDEQTRQAFYKDFYITGDIGRLENDFLYITDRLKRFAKIGGEMVPLLPIEDKLSDILDKNGENENRQCAVINIPDAQKGEQIVGIVVDPNPDKLYLNAELDQNGITKLSQPNHYLTIDTIPMLASGKIDYRSLKDFATKELVES